MLHCSLPSLRSPASILAIAILENRSAGLDVRSCASMLAQFAVSASPPRPCMLEIVALESHCMVCVAGNSMRCLWSIVQQGMRSSVVSCRCRLATGSVPPPCPCTIAKPCPFPSSCHVLPLLYLPVAICAYCQAAQRSASGACLMACGSSFLDHRLEPSSSETASAAHIVLSCLALSAVALSADLS